MGVSNGESMLRNEQDRDEAGCRERAVDLLGILMGIFN